jgi:hypothetical protein
VRPTTYRSYVQHVTFHIVPHIGSFKLEKVGGATLNALYAKLACVFRRKPNTDSAPSRTLIPRQAEHRFRSKPNTDSARSRTVSRLRAEAMTGR